MKKHLILLILILSTLCLLTGCKKEEKEPEKPNQGEITVDPNYVIEITTKNINNYLFSSVSYSLMLYDGQLSSDNFYGEIFYNKPYDTLVINNLPNGGIRHTYYYSKHYWDDGENWYYDDKKTPETNVENFIPKVETTYEPKLLDNEIINEKECYAVQYVVPTENGSRTIIYYVDKITGALLASKENNIITLLEYETKDFELNSMCQYKESE